MKAFLRLVNFCLLLLLLGATYVAFDAWHFLHTAPAQPGEELLFDVESGANFAKIADQLEKRGLISDAARFTLLARYKQQDSKLQAGRFKLHSGWLPGRLLEELVNGQPLLYRITVREGLSWWELAQLFEREGFIRSDDFRAVIFDPDFLRHYGIPFVNAEGFLYPDTYLLQKPDKLDKTTARALAGRLIDTFWQKSAALWPEGRRPGRDELRTLLILASIVEKESALAAERPRVAGVYANRLRIKMPLQADPTVIYGLGTHFDGNLRRSHLEDPKNLYNTYKLPGLPPGPICSPGLASIRAALAPEQHNYLYFVAKGDGSHVFSSNLADHNIAVRQWIQHQRKQSKNQQ